MPIPKPSPKENYEIYISRCIKAIYDEYGHEQATAICNSQWGNKNMKNSEEIFVLKPKKAENRGTYLSRCAAHSRMKADYPNMKDRMGFCLNSFNSYYKYWSKLDNFGEAETEGTALGDCIAKEKAKGFDYKEAYAHCASKVVVSPGPVVLSNEDNLIVEPVAMEDTPVSIDFDDTANTPNGKELLQKLIDSGVMVHIITRRQQSASRAVYDLADEFGIPKDRVHFTNGKLKWEMIKRLGIKKHIDNNPDELKAIKENLPDVIAEKFEDMV
jgi:hypothetical protein